VRQALLYPVQPMLTFILISISVCIFLVQFVSKDQYQQVRDLTVVTPLGLLQHQWWRLLTTTFVHGSPLHLAFNMYALYALGQGAERIWGRGRFLAIYIIAAIGGTCLAMAVQPFPCVGASGAICGIFAGEAAWVFYNRGHLDPRVFSAWNRNFLINVVLIAFISFFPGVSWGAHLGGAIAGLLIALWLNYFQFQPGWRRWLQWLGIIIIPLVSVGLLVRTMQTGSQWQEIRQEAEREEINNEVDPLLEQRADRRKSQEVSQAINHLDETIQNLQEAAEPLQKRGPFVSRFVERVRQLRLRLTEAWITLLQLAKECLQKGEGCTEKEEEKLRQQGGELAKIKSEWREMLESGRSR
jgi:rhomboid protease GluP